MEDLWIYGIWSTFIYYSWDIWRTLFHGFSTLSTFSWGYLMIFDGLFHGKTHHFLSISRRCGAATRRSPWLHHPRRARWPRWPAAGGTFQRLLRLIEYSWKMIFLYNIMQLQSLDIFSCFNIFFSCSKMNVWMNWGRSWCMFHTTNGPMIPVTKMVSVAWKTRVEFFLSLQVSAPPLTVSRCQNETISDIIAGGPEGWVWSQLIIRHQDL